MAKTIDEVALKMACQRIEDLVTWHGHESKSIEELVAHFRKLAR